MVDRKKKKQDDLAEDVADSTTENDTTAAEPVSDDSETEVEDISAVKLSELEEAHLQWQQEKEELLDRIKRKQADIDNLRRISRKEQAEAREYALHEFLCRLLPVLDNLERGLLATRESADVPESYIEGLEMIRNQLLQILEQEEVSKIEAVGAPFDPNYHHAVIQVDRDQGEPGTIVEELQKGYCHRKRVLRPAMVKVCQD